MWKHGSGSDEKDGEICAFAFLEFPDFSTSEKYGELGPSPTGFLVNGNREARSTGKLWEVGGGTKKGMRERLPAEVSAHVPSTPPSAASTWNVACCGSRPPSQSCPSCLGTKSLASDCCSGQSPEGSTLTQGKSRVGYADITTARQLGTTLSVPFVTTLTLPSHFLSQPHSSLLLSNFPTPRFP